MLQLRRTSNALLGAGIAIAIAAAALIPAPAFAAEADSWFADDRYYQVLYDGGLTPWRITHVEGNCPTGYYLDKNFGTPGLSVGQGFLVERETGVSAVEVGAKRQGPLEKNERLVMSTVLEVFNGWVADRGLKITMVCTTSVDQAWRAPYSPFLP